VRIATARDAGLPGISSFAKGLEQDLDAVTSGLTMTWSSGPVGGRGRASLPLLRKRVLLTDDERQQWTLDPFVSVEPLRFDTSPDEVSQAPSSVTGDSQACPRRGYAGEAFPLVTQGEYREFGLHRWARHLPTPQQGLPSFRVPEQSVMLRLACLGAEFFEDG
jgi:hypothetical protein